GSLEYSVPAGDFSKQCRESKHSPCRIDSGERSGSLVCARNHSAIRRAVWNFAGAAVRKRKYQRGLEGIRPGFGIGRPLATLAAHTHRRGSRVVVDLACGSRFDDGEFSSRVQRESWISSGTPAGPRSLPASESIPWRSTREAGGLRE